MNYLSAENLAKAFGEQLLFKDLTFGLARGDKTALIARNGTGKTTLLRILGGKESSDSGEFNFRKGIKVAFLEQAPELDNSLTIEELIRSANTATHDITRRYEQLLIDQGEGLGKDSVKALNEATDEMDKVKGWDYERRLKQLLDLFSITNLLQAVSGLSGGEKKRLALALVLLDEPEFIILDEPTNHLDIDMIEWLEKYLSQTNLTILMVTHDRYFLDRVCNRILELDQGILNNYQGNYAYFLEKREERVRLMQAEKDKANQLMKKELEWLRRMPKARSGKSKARIDAFDGIKQKAIRDLDEKELQLQVKTPRLGGKILDLSHIHKKYGPLNILSNFNYKFVKGERLGIIGKNGTGKTTLLNIISGREKADSGNIDTGETLVMGYYRQLGHTWKANQRVIDAVKEIAEVVELKNGRTISASRFLEHFLFPSRDQYKVIAKLSGGELRRLHLLTVLIKNPNFLILDEPTNDLDLFALNKLEEFLLAYEGCLVIVSHDRYFLDKLTDHLFIFEGNAMIKDHYGRYTDYREQLDNKNKVSSKVPEQSDKLKKKSIAIPGKQKKTKLSYKEKIEYEKLEPEIEALEAEKKGIEEEMILGNLVYEALHEKSLKVNAISKLIDKKMERWMELGMKMSDFDQ